LAEALGNLSGAASCSKPKIYNSYVQLAYNVTLWHSKFSQEESDLYLITASCLLDLLETQKVKDTTMYYILGVVGTSAHVSKTAKSEILEAYKEQLEKASKLAFASTTSPALREMGADISKVFELK